MGITHKQRPIPEVTVIRPTRCRRRRRDDVGLAGQTVVLGLAAAFLAATLGTVLLNGSSAPLLLGSGPLPTATPTPAPTVKVAVAGVKGSTVPWQQPLRFSIGNGTLIEMTATAADGTPLPGTLSDTTWVSASRLVPGQTYRLHAEVRNNNGEVSTIDRSVRATEAPSVLHASVSPAGGIFGIGQAVIVRFDEPVKGVAARTAVLKHLHVTTTPAVTGAWRWYNSYEVHYRGPTYWKPGTKISVKAALSGLLVPGTDVWGANKPVTRQYTIGAALVATVDVTAHKMTVTRNGKVVRVMNVSTGREEYPTKGGVHVVLVREKRHLYNSATIGIPTASPDGYYEYLPWSVRISNGGAFVHANPDTVSSQGRRNVSHGCVNMSVADAKWFYDNSHLGDIVNVIHSPAGPDRFDAGMFDWNYTWDEWKTG